jgi:hypothetical protein
MRFLIILLPLFLFGEILKIDNLKKEYYQNQIVNLNGRIILQNDINITAIPSKGIELNLTKTNPYVYKIDIKFKADNNKHSIILIGPKFYKELNLNKLIKIKKLTHTPKNFSGVFAKSLEIVNPIASRYDSNKTILSFTIKCKNCNIEDFNLSNEQNLTLISNSQATYYIMLPKNKKEFSFFYFDLNTSSFKRITIPITLTQQTISTQTNINPEENTFFTPVNILILSVIAFFLLIFLVYQKVWILFFPILLGGYLIYSFIPKGEIILPANTKVQILPTKNSTIIYITSKNETAKVLKREYNYIKVKIKNKIGWVKDENSQNHN